jgi:RNA polymerase primary sigma factor
MPLHRAALARRIGRVQSRLEQRLGRTPTAEETAREAGLSTREVENTLRASAPVVSLDKPLQEEDGDSLGDITADPDQEMPDQGCTDASSRRFIDRMLDELDPRERQILLLYYGMGDEEPYSLAEIGHRYRMTRERTRQLKQRAINRIRRSLPSHKRATLGV